MSKRIITGVLILVQIVLILSCSTPPKEVRVITDRTESHLTPLMEYYTKKTGTKINAVFVEKGLLPRLEARPQEADIVITSTINLLETARSKDLLQAFTSSRLKQKLPASFRDPENYYFTTSYRARAIYYSKDRVKAEELSTYEDLTSPKWKGRVCIRSGYHEYNLCLFSQMAATMGFEKTRSFVEGLHANLALPPKDNDRAQVRAIYEGKCDVAIVNSYYMGIMLSTEDQRDWGLSAKVFFPNQNDGGTYILQSGAALTKATENKKEAEKFLEFLVDDYAQQYMGNTLYEYPINDKLPLSDVNKSLGDEQKEVVDGKFKIHFVPLKEIEKYRPEIIKVLDEINFDNK
ncbi:MAG: extracellular solute-binding protein [Spirochaetales bacterium]|nr:extracellular solute-binding protein [Spirochaetales bacterium]